MKQKKTLAQVAKEVESNDEVIIKSGNFESFTDFMAYYNIHYKPLLRAIRDGKAIDEKSRHLLNFLADDLLQMFFDE